MKDLKLFSIEEMSALDALNIKGGIADIDMEESQTSCSNNVTGCNCTIVIQRPSLPSQS